MRLSHFIGRHKYDVLTPALLLDLDKVERNIARMAAFFESRPCKLRPHAKSHKLPWIALEQVRAGAIGITCAKLQDAESFAAAGVDSILIANEVVGAERIRRLGDLCRTKRIIVCVDSDENASDLSEAAVATHIRIDVLVEIDTGLGRCGVQPGAPALAFVRKLAALPGLRFRGVMGYEGGLFLADPSEKERIRRERIEAVVGTRELLERNGVETEIVSSGGSNTYAETGSHRGVTEVQAGSYVTMDDYNRRYGIDFEQAVTVLATVISRPAPGRIIIDAGLKALSADHGDNRVVGHEGVQFQALNEEHGRLVGPGGTSLKVGDRLEIVPSHGCTTIPLYRHYTAVRGDRVVDEMPLISGGAAY